MFFFVCTQGPTNSCRLDRIAIRDRTVGLVLQHSDPLPMICCFDDPVVLLPGAGCRKRFLVCKLISRMPEGTK